MQLKSPFITRGGVVASENYFATKIGLELLDRGGNAVDASIATSFALSVAMPHLGGLGGDFFALYYEKKTGRVYCINSSGFAPRKLTIEKVQASGYTDGMPLRGPLAISVPGYVYGTFNFHKRFGSKKFTEIISPSINLAIKGYPISAGFYKALNTNFNILQSDEGGSKIFLGAIKRLSEGAIIKFPEVAKTLSIIRDEGPKGFYDGKVCESIVEYVQSKQGVLEKEDMKKFKPEWVTPIRTTYRNYNVYEVPPNSMGATTLILLNMLEKYDLKPLRAIHYRYLELFLKLIQISYHVRDEHLSDPRFVKIDLKKLLSKEYSSELLKSYNQKGRPRNVMGDTTYFAVADREGNVVSAIQSLFLGFGSGLTVPQYGIPLNSRASYFKFEGVNKLQPGKRTLHTLSAMLLTSEKEVVALGSSAGDLRPQIYAQLVANYVDFDLGLQGAIENPRFVLEGKKLLLLEDSIDTGRLAERYNIKRINFSSSLGVAQGVKVCDSTKWASCDIRGDGLPLGQSN
ncbi:MAG: gamma-glutamyltransferase family protein [Nitrososphaeria archaeon]